MDEVVDTDQTIWKPYHLCMTCRKFVSSSVILSSTPDVRPVKTVESFEHHSSLTDLLTSAEAGCHLCTLAQVELGRQHYIFSYQRRQESLATLYNSEQVIVSVVFADVNNSPRDSPRSYAKLGFSLEQPKEMGAAEQDGRQDTCLELFRGMPNSNMAFYGLLPNCHESPTIVDAARFSLSTGSDACFAFLRGCMQWCPKSHRTCSFGLEEGSPRPSRLIKTGSPEKPDTARICLFEELPTTTSYLTLSHCWGSYNIPMLKTTNLVP